MEQYEKKGYLNSDFKIFHLITKEKKSFEYHYHDFYKIVIFIKGNVSYSIEGKQYKLEPYDIVLVNAGEVHRPIVEEDSMYERIIVYISTSFMQYYKTEQYDLRHCFQKARTEHSNVLRIDSLQKSKLYQVTSELEKSLGDTDYAGELYRQILFLEFMIQLNRATIHNDIHYIEMNDSNPFILKIMEYVNTHLKENITINHIAKYCFMSRYYVMHLFKEETGSTLGNYINNKRLAHAKYLIQQGYNVTTACYESGFQNYSTFSRAFKKYYGSTPRNTVRNSSSNV